ncbi:MAG: isoprenyl transferase [Clostridia bacterium]|nr:isoprenyl transferase [Clostridia bacterium]
MEKLIETYGLDRNNIPRHVAIIMDGNGRWAKKRGLPRSLGHKAGMDALRALIKASSRLGIEVLTFYAFSTENWNRPKAEVSTLFNLLVEYYFREIDELHKNGVKIRILGDYSKLPENAVSALSKAVLTTKNNTGLQLNLAINYGSRDEILMMVQSIASDVKAGLIEPKSITKELLASRLYTTDQPDPDLIIRTAGEKRLSNYLLYQAAYSEFVFTDTFFPDFDEKCYMKCLLEYQSRIRRFGGLKKGEE